MQRMAFIKKKNDRKASSKGCRIYVIVERKVDG
jgi:hypothetical protein